MPISGSAIGISQNDTISGIAPYVNVYGVSADWISSLGGTPTYYTLNLNLIESGTSPLAPFTTSSLSSSAPNLGRVNYLSQITLAADPEVSGDLVAQMASNIQSDSAVPIPAAVWLLLGGLGALGIFAWFRRALSGPR
jgi:hypothetical protein